MKTLTVKINRLYLHHIADCKDYELEKALAGKMNLRFFVRDTKRYITIPFDKLHEGEMGLKIFQTKQRNSKHKTYRLVSFSVRSDATKEEERKVKEEPEQLSAFEAMAQSPNINKHLANMRRLFK